VRVSDCKAVPKMYGGNLRNISLRVPWLSSAHASGMSSMMASWPGLRDATVSRKRLKSGYADMGGSPGNGKVGIVGVLGY